MMPKSTNSIPTEDVDVISGKLSFQAHTVQSHTKYYFRRSLPHVKILPLSTMSTIRQPQDKMEVPYGMPM